MAIYRFLLTAAAGGVLVFAQSQNPRTQPGQRDQTTTSTKSGTLSSADREFLQRTYENNLLEVEIAKLASQKASNTQVKSFAQRLVDDHGRAIKEMEDLAKKKSVTLTKAQNVSTPDSKTATSSSKDQTRNQQHSGAHSTLSTLSGDAFDRAWVREMVEEHEMGIKSFETQQSSATDADVKNFVGKMLPTLRTHLDLAKSLDQKLGQGGAGSSGATSTPRNDNPKNKNEKPATDR